MTLESPPLDSLSPAFTPGSVWLTGAGPGDPGLLTLHALHGLRTADVIVHDALIDPRILALAGPAAVLEFAGKRGGRPSPRQQDITLRLIALAREGKRVLRLKGGDPFVFGRGGEEAMGLAQAGIPFRVIPGITAGLGGLAAAGIPATTRDTNHAVILATGHLAEDSEDDGGVDWAALARTGQPIVLYMAMRNLAPIAAALMAAGLAAETPVAVVADATLPQQRVLETTLHQLADAVAAAGIEPPAIIAVGRIVALRRLLTTLMPPPRP